MTDEEIKLIIKYPHLLGNLAGYDRLTNIHSEWCRYLFNPSRENRSIMSHRGSFKSTMLSTVGPIYWSLWYPNDTIGIVRKNFTDACENINRIKLIMAIEEIKAVFQYVHGGTPVPLVKKANKLTYGFKTKITQEGTYNACSIKTPQVGKHYDMLIFDDFVTIEDRMSKAERTRTIAMVEEYVENVLNPGGLAIFIGTPWHEDDAWSICPKPLKFDCYSTGLMSEIQILEKKQKTTNVTFSANYELRIVKGTNDMFTNTKFKRWDFRYRKGIGHMDKAYFGDDTSAVTFICKKEDGSGRYQGIGWIYEDGIASHWSEIVENWKKYYIGTVYTEDNDDKGFCSSQLAARGVPVQTYHESQNKHVKITTHAKENGFWDLIDWEPATDPRYLAQIADYHEGASPDDAPDSLSCIGRIIFGDDQNYTDRWKK